MTKKVFIFAYIILVSCRIFADVKGTEGQIKFDVNSDGQFEMNLDSAGLAIGASSADANLHVNGNAIISQSLQIGSTSSQSNLSIAGSVGMSIQNISSNTSQLLSSVLLIDSSSDNVLLTLPYAGNVTGREYVIKKTSQLNEVYIAGGGNSIDDFGAISMDSNDWNLPFLKVVSSGEQWLVLNQSDGVETVAMDNLISWYRLDESSGNTASDVIGSYPGTLQAGLAFENDSSDGINQSALEFDGVDDYITLAASSTMLAGDSSFTLSGWFKTGQTFDTSATFPNIGGRMITLARNGSGSSKLGLGFYGDNTDTLMVYYYTSSAQSLLHTGSNFNDNTWHHLAVTYDKDSNQLILYYDGQNVESVNAGTITNSGAYVGVIGSFRTEEYYQGFLDDIRIYDFALSSTQIQALAFRGL